MVGMMGWEAPQQGWRKGPWTPEEDKLLSQYVNMHGEGRWSSVARSAGLNRSGKSCRLRWVNYLRPGLKRGHITPQEEGIIIELHALWGNKWSTIARYLPGRTDNEIKNYWRTHFKKKDRSSQKQERRKAQILKLKQQKQQDGTETETDPKTEKMRSSGIILSDQTEPVATADGTKVTSQETDNYYQVPQGEKAADQMVLMCPSLEDQCLPVMSQEAAVSWLDQYLQADELGLWGGLWNWNLQQDDSHCNKIAMQTQAKAAYPFGGDANNNNLYNGGYIF